MCPSCPRTESARCTTRVSIPPTSSASRREFDPASPGFARSRFSTLSGPNAVRVRLDRLRFLLSQDQPYYLQIAPYAPHVQNNLQAAMPQARHMDLFPDAKAPRLPNYNPADEFQAGKRGWPGTLPLMNETTQRNTDYAYRRRAQALQGVDEIIEDVVAMLAAKGTLDNTYSEFGEISQGNSGRGATGSDLGLTTACV